MDNVSLASPDALGWGILIFVGLLFGVPYTRFILRKIAIPRWPIARAAVTEVSVGRGLPGTGGGYLSFFNCRLNYKFDANGSTYTGWFALGAGSPEDAFQVARQTQNMTLEVRYNPREPKDSVPLEKEILERPVLLGESWLNPRVW